MDGRRRELDVRRVPAVAKRQGGVFTTDQARAEGWTDRQVRYRVQARHWVPVAGRAVAASLARAPAWSSFQLATAARLTVPGAVVSHRTAAGIHEFPVGSDGSAHIIAKSRHGRVRNISVHRLRLPDSEVETC